MPSRPTTESMLDEVFRYQRQDGDARFVQFYSGKVRLVSRTQIDDVYEPIVIGEYDNLEDLYMVAKTENDRNQLIDQAARKGSDLYLYDDSDVQVVDTPFIEELDQFIKEGVSEQDIIDAARETVAYREATGLDEATLMCNLCKGGGCTWCDGEGSIAKYPEITISNLAGGERITLDLNIAEMIARGDISVKKTIFSKAYSHGSVSYEEGLYVLFSESMQRQLSGFNLDPDSSALLVDGKIHSVEALNFDLRVATNYWNRNGDTADIDPSEITYSRCAHAMGGSMGLMGGSKDYTAHELIFIAQHQVSQFLGSVFNNKGFNPKESWNIEVIPMKTADESLVELQKLVNNKGYCLSYTNFLAIGNNFMFLMQDESGNTVESLAINEYSFRMALENAKHKLVSGE